MSFVHGCSAVQPAPLSGWVPRAALSCTARSGKFSAKSRGTVAASASQLMTHGMRRQQHWTAAGMMEAAKGFRRLKAYKHLPVLRAALAAHQSKYATQRVEH